MPEKMRAVRKVRREPGLDLVEMDIPEIKPDEVLLKVEATAICGSDVHFYKWDDYAANRLNPPITIGHEFAGEIVDVGKDVKNFHEGDYVAADSHIVCGKCAVCKLDLQHICQNLKIFGNEVDGSFAEYIAVPATSLWPLSRDVPPEVGATMEPLGGAVQTVLIEPVTAQTVAIFGDGPIALFAVGVARAAGASRVFHVGKYPFRQKIAEQMGAHVLLSIKDEQSPVDAILEQTNGVGVDNSLMILTVGYTFADNEAWAYYEPLWTDSEYGELTDPGNSYTIQYYDLVIVTALAIEAAGSVESDAWTAAVPEVTEAPGTECFTYDECLPLIREGEDVNYQGITGDYNYSDTGVVSGLFGSFQWTDLETLERVQILDDTAILELDAAAAGS